MIKYFVSGDLVKSTRPDFKVPADEARRLGLIVCHVPPGVGKNTWAVPMLLVAWTGPRTGEAFTLEPDHRVQHV